MPAADLQAFDRAPALSASADLLCEQLTWDSEFFGINIGRLWGDRLTPERIDAALRWRDEHGIDCLYFLADASDPSTARIAAGVGFRVVDFRCTYDFPVLSESPPRI